MINMTTFTGALMKVTCFLLLLLPFVDMVDEHKKGERKSGGVSAVVHTVHLHQSLDNQTRITTEVTGGAISFSGNWNSLSPTTLSGTATSLPTTGVSTNPSTVDSNIEYYKGSASPSLPSSSASSSAYSSLESTYFTHPSSSAFPISSSRGTTKHYYYRNGHLAPVTTASVTTTSHHQSFQFHKGGSSNITNDSQQRSAEQKSGSSSSSTRGTTTFRQRSRANNQLVSFVGEPQPPPPVSLASSTRITGPYFESNKTTVHVSARAGQTVMLDCAVVLLQGRMVSWLRRKKETLQLLTVGNTTYYSDSRIGLRFRYPNNWRLGIESVNKKDAGEYQCQLSTHPPKILHYQLHVIAPAVVILDENGHTVTERHYKVDSSLHLTCRASHVDKFAEKVVWLKGDRALPGGDSRIKVKLTKNQNAEILSTLAVLSVRKTDSGNYSCSLGASSSTISVHVLNGELPAAVQHESSTNRFCVSSGLVIVTMILLPMILPLITSTSA